MAEEPKVNMLSLALRKIKGEKAESPAEESSAESSSVEALEQAMEDFQNATSKSERAAAFKAALALAK